MNYLKSHTKLWVGGHVAFSCVVRIPVFHEILKAIFESPNRKEPLELDCMTEKEVPWGHGSQAFLGEGLVFWSDFFNPSLKRWSGVHNA